MDKRVDVEGIHSLHQGEEAEEDGGHRYGGQTGHPAQAVFDTGGGGRLSPGQWEVTSHNQVDDEDHLDWSLQAPGHGLHLVSSQLISLQLSASNIKSK